MSRSAWRARNTMSPVSAGHSTYRRYNRQTKSAGPDIDSLAVSRRPVEVTWVRARRRRHTSWTACVRCRTAHVGRIARGALARHAGGLADGRRSRTARVRLARCSAAAAAYSVVLPCNYGLSAPPWSVRG
ncbi:hypothetical protein CERSUDRAFT_120311 [Gelatoporia subvermispora B]|uniref:Uncharacterized protein n=1 Tax=Ceriporiopsis subvermispora (strain B) TaxID=914234 RepID=M2QFH2_CERS8|nr:hypothetical protein CERSUDRAFT_120311 [Gelatoporia subvermispora B]